MPCSCNQGWICEQHPDRAWLHDSCPGPGIPCEAANCPYRADPLKDLLEMDFAHSGAKGKPDEFILKIAEHVRKVGHSALAERFISAHMDSLRAEDVCAQFIRAPSGARDRLRASQGLTDWSCLREASWRGWELSAGESVSGHE
jgi:hypothetical protein